MTQMPPRVRKLLFLFLLWVVAPSCGSGSGSPPAPAPPGGSLDATFGTGGIVLMSAPGANLGAIGLAVQSDGKIVAVGSHSTGSNAMVIRYLPDGTPDPSFGATGVVLTLVGGFYSYARAVAIQSDGKIVVAGDCGLVPSGGFLLIRYNSDGTLDPTFDSDGSATLTAPGGSCTAHSLAIQPDGKILAAGPYYSSGGKLAVARFNSDGSLDLTFDGDGLALVVVEPGVDNFCNGVALQPDGKILLVGESSAANSNFIIARLNSDGSLDTSFDGDGKASIPLHATSYDGAYRAAVTPSGKIVIAGQARHADGTQMDIAVARLNADGSLDPTFNGGGKVITPVGSLQEAAYAMTLMPDGRVLVAGFTDTGIRREWILVRYLPDGSLDLSFDGDGIRMIPVDITGGFEGCFALALQPDGKIVGAGFARNAANQEWVVLRVHP